MDPCIRLAEITDLEAIREIYNDAVLTTTATFDIEPRTYEKQLEWFSQHNNKFQVIVFEIDGIIAGWASISKWSDRIAYEGTAENSVYVKKEFRNHGIGRRLLSQLIQNALNSGLHTIIARIAGGNQTSIRMHAEFGFEIIGIMKEAGMKFGRYIDVTLMQKML
jgi:L-amino acid N-acyltransferase YncA